MSIVSTLSAKIVLIDDEVSVLSALKLLLQAFGYSVSAFSLPREALEHLSMHDDYDLIVSDLRMPELSGLDVLRIVKRRHAHIPLILISGHAGEDEINEATALGAAQILLKPFEPHRLKQVVEQITKKAA